MLGRILDGMKPYFGTTSDIAIAHDAPGTGGLEAAVVNTLSPGDRVLGVSIGSFGDRFAKIARTYGADVTKIEVEWGQAADPARSARRARARRRLQGRPADPQRDLDRRDEPDRRAGRGRPRGRARRADPRRQRVGPRRRAVRDGRLGRRRRRHRLAEGLDGRPGPGDDRRLGARPGPRWRPRRCRASTSTCARIATRHADGQTPFTPAIAVVYQVDEGLRLMNAEGTAERLRPPRGVRRGDAGRPRRRSASSSSPTRRTPRRRSPRRGVPDGPRLEGVQRRAQAPRRRPRRRPGQAHRQDLPARPPRLGHGRGDPRCDRARSRSSSIGRGPPGPARAPRSPPRRSAALESYGVAAPAGRPGGVREDPGRRADRARGRRAAAGRPRGRRAAGPHAATSCARSCPTTTRSIVRSQVQVDAGADRGRARGCGSSAGPASASTTSTSTPRRGPGSPSSTPRPATRSRPPSTPSRCSTASPAGSPAADASLRRGEWKRAQFTGLELRGRTLGIVGLGKIGQAIAVRAAGDGDDGPRRRPVRHRRGRPPTTASSWSTFDEMLAARRRRHRPRAADARDARPDRARRRSPG